MYGPGSLYIYFFKSRERSLLFCILLSADEKKPEEAVGPFSAVIIHDMHEVFARLDFHLTHREPGTRRQQWSAIIPTLPVQVRGPLAEVETSALNNFRRRAEVKGSCEECMLSPPPTFI